MTLTGTSPRRAWLRSVGTGFRLSSPEGGPSVEWFTDHPIVFDLVLAVAVAVVTGLADALSSDYRSKGALGWDLALAAALILRRRWPASVAVVVGGICLAQWVVGVRAIGDVDVLVVLYSLGVYERRRWVLVAAILTAELGVIMAVTRWGAPSNQLVAGITATGTVTASWVIGIYLRMRRAYLASIRERAETAERERDSRALIAVAAERARLAREMHDVIAHSLSVMITLNDAAAAVEPSQQVREVLSQASDVGRQALSEMHRMLRVLREGDDTEYTPQPGLGQLPDLVSMVRSAGLHIELAVTGDPAPIPATAQLALYRIVQESLTNVLKHGRNVENVRVAVTRRGPIVDLRVDNDGSAVELVGASTGGHGLSGMSERAKLFGGEIFAGPAGGGGWSVRAQLHIDGSATRT